MPTQSDNTLISQKTVVFLCRRFWPLVGGVERHVLYLSKELQKKGWSVSIITENTTGDLLQKASLSGCTVIRIPIASTKTKLGIWSWFWQHKSLWLSADVVHAHDVFWWIMPFAILRRNTFFTTFHGYERAEGPTKKSVLWRLASHYLSKKTIAVGSWIRDWYKTPSQAVTYGAGNCAKSIRKNTSNAVYIGRLAPDTGILTTIEAVKTLGGKIQLDVYGDGPLKNVVLRSIEHTPYIKYKGETDAPEQIWKKYRFACVGQYLGMIEALQSGCFVFPFVQPGSGLKVDYLQRFPAIRWLSQWSEASELATLFLENLKDFPESIENQQHAQHWALQQTWKKVAQVYEDVWKK